MNKHTQTAKRRLVFKIITLTLCLISVVLIIVPPVAVYFITNGHIEYELDESHPLQKVYSSSDFGLISNDRMLTTEDGYRVWASEVAVDNPKAVIIYLSGIQQPSVTYFYGHAKWLKKEGYASILLEVRGHGKSEGTRVSLGFEEVKDVQAVMDYIKMQQSYANIPVVIHGVSMGGAIAVNAFGQIPEIDGLIAMSAYSSFEEVVIETMKQYHVPGFIAAIEKPLFRLALGLAFGKESFELVPEKQVQNIGDRPALFIASAFDTEVIPANMERLLARAPQHSEGWLRVSEKTGHFIIENHNIEDVELDTEYCQRILAFLEEKVLP